ncbi:MAG TPA: DsbE family thiol:disulfide interchange protein [Wenzhouxiangella sp.]|nr:DsbE family thiol:disulfide interchange protein [Wenzhouxiangella sp.]HLS04767.1 DsbE family thiol:disulfide interchange protein [Wenzhouxiangella sp.]
MIRALIPLGVFVALIILLVVGLQTSEERKLIQSPLIGKPIPEFSLPTMQDPEARITHNDLIGEPFMLNVWGSWCWACREEHPFIERLGREAPIELIGFNWKDRREDALAWIERYGNSWSRQVVDFEGQTAIDLGVYGAPETFLVDHRGIIRHKLVGPVNANSFDDLMRRAMQLRAETQ